MSSPDPETWWIVERVSSHRFPFRIRIEQDGVVVVAVRAQREWPGPGAQVFCLRDGEVEAGEERESYERVPVASLARLGRRLLVTLDRGTRKRCEFLKIEKRKKDGTAYEQIFFRTERATRAHRTSGRVELRPSPDLDVAIDTSERYPWRFPGATVVRRKLAVGDYALLVEDRPVAVAERKSLSNFLTDVGAIRALHQQLVDLAGQRRSALVVEAQYGDLGNPKKINRWPAAHLLRVVAELQALHPTVPLVFAGNRKMANVWTQQWFQAVAASSRAPQTDLVCEEPTLFHAAKGAGRLDTQIRVAALRELPSVFVFGDLRARFPEVGDGRLRRILYSLRDEGRLRVEGRGRAARWRRT